MNTNEQALVDQIVKLREHLCSLMNTDEFCYLPKLLEDLDQEKKWLLAQFQTTSHFLKILNKFSQKTRDGHYPSIERVNARVETITYRFLREIKRVYDGRPESLAIYDKYTRLMEDDENNQLVPIIKQDLASLKERINENARKQSLLIVSYEERQREIRKEIKAKEAELSAMRQTPQRQVSDQGGNNQPIASHQSSASVPHRRRKPKRKNEAEPVPDCTPPPWQFRLVFNDYEDGITMPQGRKSFIRMLDSKLKENRIFHLKLNAFYDKLMSKSKLDANQRFQDMDVISSKGLHSGWYKLRSSTFRVLLSFNDKERIIKFRPGTHDMYEEIWLSE